MLLKKLGCIIFKQLKLKKIENYFYKKIISI
jgi:hypothetical protein